MSRYRTLPSIAFAAAAAAALLSGCGRQGALERPAPLFGGAARAEYEAQRAQDARDDAQRAEQRPPAGQQAQDNAPRTTRDVLDPNQRRAPASSAPIPGASNPLGNAVSPFPR